MRREEREGNAARHTDRAAECAVAEIDHRAYRARPHGVRDGHAVQLCKALSRRVRHGRSALPSMW
jgi:hypothetical protein